MISYNKKHNRIIMCFNGNIYLCNHMYYILIATYGICFKFFSMMLSRLMWPLFVFGQKRKEKEKTLKCLTFYLSRKKTKNLLALSLFSTVFLCQHSNPSREKGSSNNVLNRGETRYTFQAN